MLPRRTVIASLLAALAVSGTAAGARAGTGVKIRSLRLHNLHTSERLDLAYWMGGRYLDKSLVALNHFLRDHHLQRVGNMDPRLLDLLWIVQTALPPSSAIEVLSGYRSAMTNRLLAYRHEGVAVNSYHIQGKAIDIRVPGHIPGVVAVAARAVGYGGVGLYDSFVHIDVGPVRNWNTYS
ncbi:MAG: DUF882 domain-containing protein [Alphaproteobacteria bacterium]|nr:DUF882 domain-containing protein [Alphaproteobacteria bacterium]